MGRGGICTNGNEWMVDTEMVFVEMERADWCEGVVWWYMSDEEIYSSVAELKS